MGLTGVKGPSWVFEFGERFSLVNSWIWEATRLSFGEAAFWDHGAKLLASLASYLNVFSK